MRMGSWSNGTTPPWRGGNPSSILGGSTDIRKVAGYGSPGRFAKPCGFTAMWVQIPRLPLRLLTSLIQEGRTRCSVRNLASDLATCPRGRFAGTDLIIDADNSAAG